MGSQQDQVGTLLHFKFVNLYKTWQPLALLVHLNG